MSWSTANNRRSLQKHRSLDMMGKRSRLGVTVQTLLLVWALAWCASPVAEGASAQRTESAATASRSGTASRASSSPFVKLQLAKPQHQQVPKVSQLDAACFFNCRTATPAFPTCCSFLGLGICVNTQIDPNNCGKCGTRCALGTFCCSGSCTNTLTDVNNCGFCGRRCPQPGACNFGFCNYG